MRCFVNDRPSRSLRLRPSLLAAAPALLLAAGAGAEVPGAIAFQGYLADDLGAPVEGSVALVVALYETETSPGALWSESHPEVFATGGIFTVELGSIVAFSDTLFDRTALWLGISVEGEAEMPRTRLLTTPFAFRARDSDRLAGAGPGEFLRADGDTVPGVLRLAGGVEVIPPSGGVTEVVASTNDIFVRRWILTGTAHSWNDVSARVVVVANGTPGAGAGIATIARDGLVVATFALNAAGSRPWAHVVNLDVDDGTTVDVTVRATVGGQPVLLRSVTLETIAGETMAAPVTLDEAYDAGGPGAGRTIVADAGAVEILGEGGLAVAGPLTSTAAAGDGAIVLPDGSISSAERLDEPGIVRDRAVGNTPVTDSIVEMIDVAVVTITTPREGYVHLEGTAQARFSASTAGNVMAVQIDETPGGVIDVSHYFFVGYASASPAGESYQPVHLTRTYLKPAGVHTFRFEAMDHDDLGSKSLWNASLTARFYPTAYGPVMTLTQPGSGGTPVEIRGNGGPSGGAELIDLRERRSGGR